VVDSSGRRFPNLEVHDSEAGESCPGGIDRETDPIIRSSLAIQLVSRARRGVDSCDFPAELQVALREGLAARKAIVWDYTRLQQMLGDLRQSAQELPVFKQLQLGSDFSEAGLIADLKTLLVNDGLLGRDGAAIEEIIEQFEGCGVNLRLIVHGFAEIRETKRSKLVFTFELYGARQQFTLGELQAEATRFHLFVREAARRIGASLAIVR
jgi:hypothetical protein